MTSPQPIPRNLDYALKTYLCEKCNRHELSPNCCGHGGAIVLPLPTPSPILGCPVCWIVIDTYEARGPMD